MPTRSPSLLVLGFAVVLAGVGMAGCPDGGSSESLRIHVETLSIDGPVPADLQALHLAEDGSEGGRHPLLPVVDGRPGEHEIRGGPEGAYRVEPPAGWGVISAHTLPPEVRRGRTPPVVRVGRDATLYLGPISPTMRPGPHWGAERIEADGSRTPLTVTTDVEPPGYGVGIRFDPEEWHGRIYVIGYLAEGLPGAATDGESTGPLADPLQVHVPEDGSPVVGSLRPAPTGDLQVIPVPAASTLDPEGREAIVEVRGLPIDVRRAASVHRGMARFHGLPALERDLWVGMADEAHPLALSPEAWGRASQIRLLWTGDVPMRTVRVKIPAGVVVEHAQVRPAGAVAYGRVPFLAEDDTVVLRAPHGAFSLLFRAGSRWASATGEGEGDVTIEASPFEEGVRIDGGVRGGTQATEIRFFRRVAADGEEAVLADGFVVHLTRFGVYEALLPTGTYVVEVADAQGVETRPSPLEAKNPGTAIHLPLHAHGH